MKNKKLKNIAVSGLALLTLSSVIATTPVFAQENNTFASTQQMNMKQDVKVDLTVVNKDGSEFSIFASDKELKKIVNEYKLKPKDLPKDVTAMTPGFKGPYMDMSQFKKTLLDVPYANTGNERHKLDIVYPKNYNEMVAKGEKSKLIVNVYGGGYVSGDKQALSSGFAQWATEQGYAVANVQYSLAPENKFPTSIIEVKAAIRYLRAHADELGLDADKIVLWGTSSGAYVTDMVALTNNNPAYEDLSMGNADESSAVQGVISYYAPLNIYKLPALGDIQFDTYMGYDVKTNKKQAKMANPFDLVTEDVPPFFLAHGTADTVALFQDSIDLIKKINDATGGNGSKLKLYVGAQHSEPIIKAVENVKDSLDFADKILFENGENPYRNMDADSYQPIKALQ
jgi:acetyl esterase/lipase